MYFKFFQISYKNLFIILKFTTTALLNVKEKDIKSMTLKNNFFYKNFYNKINILPDLKPHFSAVEAGSTEETFTVFRPKSVDN